MPWLELKRGLLALGAVALILPAGCSDDGVPAETTGGSTGGAATSTSPSEGTSTSGTTSVTSMVTTDSGSDSNDPSDSTSPSSGQSTVGTAGDTDSGVGSSGTSSETEIGTDTDGPGQVCEMPADCELVNDCCTCAAIPAGSEPPACDVGECLVPACQALSIETIGVDCVYGSCELETLACDPMFVTCDAEAPDCNAGDVPSVVEGCWGSCVPAEVCDVVPRCEDCPEDEACIASEGLAGRSFSCTPLPEACGGAASCDCLPEICEAPFDTCGDGGRDVDLTCSCINC